MIRSVSILLAASGLALASAQATAASLAAHAGTDYFGIEASQIVTPGIRVGAGYTQTDDSGRDARLYNASLMFSPATPVVDVAVGGRYQYQQTDWGNGGGLGLGGSLFVNTPVPRVAIGGYAFFTPDGLTHGSVEESREYGLQARLRLFSQTYAQAGYRYTRTDFGDRGDRRLHRGPVLGISFGI
jgi:hypothetical protein